jgi:hypothetical protein
MGNMGSIQWEDIFCVRGVISVLLSNLYLHYVLDLWFERLVKSRPVYYTHLLTADCRERGPGGYTDPMGCRDVGGSRC